MFSFSFWSILTFAGPIALASQTEESKLSLRDFLTGAFEKNPKARIAEQEVAKSVANYWLSLAQSTPEISGKLSYFRQKDSTKDARPRFDGEVFNFYQGEISGSQVFFRRGFFAALSAASLQEQMAKIEREIATRDLTIEVLEKVYAVVLNQQLTEILKRNREVQLQSLRTARQRSAIGRAQRLDVLQIQTRIALLESKIRKAENDSLAAKEELVIVTGKRGAPTAKLVVDSLLKLKNELKTESSVTTLELRKFEAERKKAEKELIVAIGKHWPLVRGTGTIGRSGFEKGDLINDDATRWQVGVTLEVPIFQGLSYLFELRSIEAEKEKLRVREIQAVNEIERDRITSRENLETAEAVLESSRKALKLANESLVIAKRDYSRANIDYLQLLSTEQSMLEAEQSLAQAEHDLILQMARFMKANGISLERLVDQLS